MSRRAKLRAKILARPPEADFQDVCAIFTEYGWSLRSTEGSHHIFVSPDKKQVFSVPTVSGRKVKRHYLDRICQILGLEED